MYTVGTRGRRDVVLMSMRHHHVASMSERRPDWDQGKYNDESESYGCVCDAEYEEHIERSSL